MTGVESRDGVEHYRHAEMLLRSLANTTRGRPEDASTIAEAQVHATLALAAATALTVTSRFVGGDSAEVTEWARTVQPSAMRTTVVTADVYPAEWPPKPGSLWDDRLGRRWVSNSRGYLFCLVEQADDNADEIWRRHGPLEHAGEIQIWAAEPPF